MASVENNCSSEQKLKLMKVGYHRCIVYSMFVCVCERVSVFTEEKENAKTGLSWGQLTKCNTRSR